MKTSAWILAFFAAIFSASTRAPAAAEISTPFQILSPKNGEIVFEDPIELIGTGADPDAKLVVTVITDKPYVQDGVATILPNKNWSYSLCHISGRGRHKIVVDMVKNGRVVSSALVSGVVRQR